MGKPAAPFGKWGTHQHLAAHLYLQAELKAASCSSFSFHKRMTSRDHGDPEHDAPLGEMPRLIRLVLSRCAFMFMGKLLSGKGLRPVI